MVTNLLKVLNRKKQHHTPVTLGVLPWKLSGFYFNEGVEVSGYTCIVGSIQLAESRLPNCLCERYVFVGNFKLKENAVKSAYIFRSYIREKGYMYCFVKY